MKLDVQGQGGGSILDIGGQGGGVRGGESWKLDNSHGRHMCIVPNILEILVNVRHFARYVIMKRVILYAHLTYHKVYIYYFLKRLF